jgi:hypothetical protein
MITLKFNESLADYWDNSGLKYNPLEEADRIAAMLRACKTGDAEWDEIIQAAHDASDEAYHS